MRSWGSTRAARSRTDPGKVNWWLAVVYLVLLVWGLYYLVIHWGGLGPGLDY